MPVAELKEFIAQHGGFAKGALERADLEERARRLVAELSGTKCVWKGGADLPFLACGVVLVRFEMGMLLAFSGVFLSPYCALHEFCRFRAASQPFPSNFPAITFQGNS
jgi:hypothetical protein